MSQKKKLSHEVIAELKAKLKWLRSRMNYERKRSYMYGYNKCVKELGKPVKPPKIKVVKEVKKVTKEVPILIHPERGDFAAFASNLIVTKAFCVENRIELAPFIILTAIYSLESATVPQLVLFGLKVPYLRQALGYLERGEWIECFRNSTKAMTIVPSLKGQKLFSSFKEYYGTDSKRKPD